MIDNIPEEMKGESATPAAHHLFDIAEDAMKLSQANADLLHHFVAQLLYLSNRASPDIHMAVSLLCTRVRGPDTYNYKNMVRAMNYILKTIGLQMIFQSTSQETLSGTLMQGLQYTSIGGSTLVVS